MSNLQRKNSCWVLQRIELFQSDDVMMLTDFEYTAVKYILEQEAPAYLLKMNEIIVKSRDFTVVGFFTHFADVVCKEEVPKKIMRIGSSVYGDIKGMTYGVGFSLYIDDGVMSMLEVFSHYHEEIPEKIAEFELSIIEPINVAREN
jgi:hypothetical protein